MNRMKRKRKQAARTRTAQIISLDAYRREHACTAEIAAPADATADGVMALYRSWIALGFALYAFWW